VNRRALLAGGTAVALSLGVSPALAAQALAAETLPLWPGPPAGQPDPAPVLVVDESGTAERPDRRIRGIATPMLLVHRPARPNGAAALVMPGGGYGYQAMDKEGTRQAAWLSARGVTAFVLVYRLPGEGWAERSLAPLADAQRAIRLIRAQAGGFGVDPARVLVLGFSAGGHLAGSLATRWAEPAYPPLDAADRLAARPDLAALIYPVVTMDAALTHAGSRAALLGPAPDAAAVAAASVERRVTADTPPCFLLHTADDTVVPVENSLMLHRALLAARRPAELHVFERGGHGFATELPGSEPAAAWPLLLAAFARRHGILPA
jgi:acetyl esterase/lipase